MGPEAVETAHNINQAFHQETINKYKAQKWFQKSFNRDDVQDEGYGWHSIIGDN